MSYSQKNKKQRRADSENTIPHQNGYGGKRKELPGKPSKYEAESDENSQTYEDESQDGEVEMGLAGVLTLYAEGEDDEDLTFYDYVHRNNYDKPSCMVPDYVMQENYAEPVESLEHILNKQEKRRKEQVAKKKIKAEELADGEGEMEAEEEAEELENDENH